MCAQCQHNDRDEHLLKLAFGFCFLQLATLQGALCPLFYKLHCMHTILRCVARPPTLSPTGAGAWALDLSRSDSRPVDAPSFSFLSFSLSLPQAGSGRPTDMSHLVLFENHCTTFSRVTSLPPSNPSSSADTCLLSETSERQRLSPLLPARMGCKAQEDPFVHDVYVCVRKPTVRMFQGERARASR